MTKLVAINYLVKHNVYTDEWSGAEMYEAVEEVILYSPKIITRKYLDKLLKQAENK